LKNVPGDPGTFVSGSVLLYTEFTRHPAGSAPVCLILGIGTAHFFAFVSRLLSSRALLPIAPDHALTGGDVAPGLSAMPAVVFTDTA